MKHSYHCKICHKPGSIEIADDYCGNLANLLAGAVCDGCHDLIRRRARLEDYIGSRCMELARERLDGEERQKIQSGLEVALRKYAEVISQEFKKPKVDTDNAVQVLMESPAKYWLILRDYRDACSALVVH